MTLSAEEFIRRFLLHVLPHGFHRIRYYGFLGNRNRQEKLTQCRQLLGMALPQMSPEPSEVQDYRDRCEKLTGVSLRVCPVCRRGHMVMIDTLAARIDGSANFRLQLPAHAVDRAVHRQTRHASESNPTGQQHR